MRNPGAQRAALTVLVAVSLAAVAMFAGVIAPGPEFDPGRGSSSRGGGEESVPHRIVDQHARTEAARERTTAPVERVTFNDWSGASLLVLDGATGEPVPEASVAVVDRRRAWQLHRPSSRVQYRIAELAESYGALARTGPDGRLRLPALDKQTLLVAAWLGGKFAACEVRGTERDEVRVVLVPDETLRVHVVDLDGRPVAAAPVRILVQVQHLSGYVSELTAGSTSENGSFIVRHFQLRRPRKAWPGMRFAAALAIPLPDPVAVEFRGRPAPAEPILLRAPATGSLEIALTDRGGRPLLSSASASLTVLSPDDRAPDSAHFAATSSHSASKDWGETRILFPTVGLGLEFLPHYGFFSRRIMWEGAPIRGPTEPGERVRLTLPLPPDWTLLTGVLVDAEASPLAHGEPYFGMAGGTHGFYLDRTRTTAEGRFEIVRQLSPKSMPEVLQFRLQGINEPGLVATRLLAGVGLGGDNYLGTLQFRPLTPQASGRVVNDLGEPVRGAQVVPQVQVDNEPDWLNYSLARGVTDEDGHFVLYSDMPLERSRLRASIDYCVPTITPEVSAGDEVEIVLNRYGRLSVGVTKPFWVPYKVSFRLVPLHDPSLQKSSPYYSGEAWLLLNRLHPGVYDLHIEVPGLGSVHTTRGIVVQRGDNPDPLPEPLDLAKLLHRYRVHAVDEDGRRILTLTGEVRARCVRPSGAVDELTVPLKYGAAQLITATPSAQLTLIGDGYQPATVTLESGVHEIPVRRR